VQSPPGRRGSRAAGAFRHTHPDRVAQGARVELDQANSTTQTSIRMLSPGYPGDAGRRGPESCPTRCARSHAAPTHTRRQSPPPLPATDAAACQNTRMDALGAPRPAQVPHGPPHTPCTHAMHTRHAHTPCAVHTHTQAQPAPMGFKYYRHPVRVALAASGQRSGDYDTRHACAICMACGAGDHQASAPGKAWLRVTRTQQPAQQQGPGAAAHEAVAYKAGTFEMGATAAGRAWVDVFDAVMEAAGGNAQLREQLYGDMHIHMPCARTQATALQRAKAAAAAAADAADAEAAAAADAGAADADAQPGAGSLRSSGVSGARSSGVSGGGGRGGGSCVSVARSSGVSLPSQTTEPGAVRPIGWTEAQAPAAAAAASCASGGQGPSTSGEQPSGQPTRPMHTQPTHPYVGIECDEGQFSRYKHFRFFPFHSDTIISRHRGRDRRGVTCPSLPPHTQ
jgi:hypothetical protein